MQDNDFWNNLAKCVIIGGLISESALSCDHSSHYYKQPDVPTEHHEPLSTVFELRVLPVLTSTASGDFIA